MNFFRKIIGLIVMLFFAMPLLFVVIWSIGITRVVVTPKFLSDIPQEIISQIPQLTDQIFETTKNPKLWKDKNAQGWVQAINKTSITPTQLLKDIGVYQWLEKDLTAMLNDFGRVLRGEIKVREIILNNQQLKNALQSEALQKYIRDVMHHLPPCGDAENSLWQKQIAQSDTSNTPIQACHPGATVIDAAIAQIVRSISALPSQITVLSAKETPLVFLGLRMAHSLMWLLFIGPVILLILGAMIGGRGSKGFFRWSGTAALLSSLPPLLISLFVKHVALIAMQLDPSFWHFAENPNFWTPELREFFARQIAPLTEKIVEPLFSSVISVSLVVFCISIACLILSLLIPHKPEPNKK
jgi:hypothetical protein